MKLILLFVLFVLPLAVFSQNDTVIYFGINGKFSDFDQKDIKKEINYRSARKVKIKTYKISEGDWKPVYTEKISFVNDSVYEISIKGKEFSGALARVFETVENNKYKFTDWEENRIKRTGFTLSKIPLIFDGEVTEYYENGNKKSVSVYKNNELISNKNWLEDGTKYIDNIFYSVDREPRYLPGMGVLHNHILEIFNKSGINFSKLDGRIVVGFVVLENGQIDGVKIEEGYGWQLNTVAVSSFKTLPGTWQPARLDGNEVRYYQLFPINFIYHNYDFDYLDLKGGSLYWEIN